MLANPAISSTTPDTSAENRYPSDAYTTPHSSSATLSAATKARGAIPASPEDAAIRFPVPGRNFDGRM